MILPQYSLRKLLLSIIGFALFCLVVSWGLRGSEWALGVSLAGLSLALALIVQALFFWVAWLFASLRANHRARKLDPALGGESGSAMAVQKPLPAAGSGESMVVRCE
jgi:hypothetical protein